MSALTSPLKALVGRLIEHTHGDMLSGVKISQFLDSDSVVIFDTEKISADDLPRVLIYPPSGQKYNDSGSVKKFHYGIQLLLDVSVDKSKGLWNSENTGLMDMVERVMDAIHTNPEDDSVDSYLNGTIAKPIDISFGEATNGSTSLTMSITIDMTTSQFQYITR